MKPSVNRSTVGGDRRPRKSEKFHDRPRLDPAPSRGLEFKGMSDLATSLRRLVPASLAGIAALAFLAIAGAADDARHASTSAPSAASSDCPDPGLNGGRGPSAFVAQQPGWLGPALPGLAATAASGTAGAFSLSALLPGVEQRFVLVNARIHEKYRPFEESLRTP